MKKLNEKIIVEDYFLEKLQANGWRFIPAVQLEREGYDEPLLTANLIRAIGKINQAQNITSDEINKTVNELKLTGTGHTGAKTVLNYFKFGIPVKFEKERVIKYVQLFNYQDIEENEFIVTNQAVYKGRENIRTDLMLYVNGIPLVNIECKNPAEVGVSWENAYRQVKNYEKIIPELYKYVQIGVAAETKAKYFPIVPWSDDSRVSEWVEEGQDSIDSAIEMLKPQTLLDIVKNFIFTRIEHGNADKVMGRYMQHRAANKIAERVINNLNGKADKNKGLIWHWQGSGKTLTMIFAAQKLFYHPALELPSIFFIVDRIELENQLYEEFGFMDIVKPEIIGSVEELKNVLSYDDYRGKRGLFVLLIHKFRPEELAGLKNILDKVSETKSTIMSRRNVVAFIDEGHRTQYGMLAGQMKAMLKNAFFFALTGTPISKEGKDTYLEFSYPKEKELYLDKYFIDDSLRDGFTVKIVYQPRLEDLHLKKDQLNTFLEVELEEIPEEYRKDVEKKTKERLDAIKTILENPKRIEKIAQDIAGHFKENIDGKFKALVVAASRQACVKYKNELDKYLPPEYTDVVMTANHHDSEPINNYVNEALAKYGADDFKQYIKSAIERFKDQEYPKILVVTDMLLTGFDAPNLQVMYLDKLLKEHRLLQAVARTNRPYKDIKEAGLIIDYVGILREFKRALEKYTKEDITNSILDYNSLKQEFTTLIDDILQLFGPLKCDYSRQTLLKTIELLTASDQKEEEFVRLYRELRKTFELLGPNEIKLEYFETYKWISAIYTYYMKMVLQRPEDYAFVQKFYDKTVKFIHKTTEIEKIEKNLPTISFDNNYLTNLKDQAASKEEKAANILFTLHRMVLVEKHQNPIYESLVDRVDKLMQLWRQKTKDYERIYTEGVSILDNFNKLQERQKSYNFTNLQYSLLLKIEEKFGQSNDFTDEIRELTKLLDIHLYPGWHLQITARKDIERELRRFIIKSYKIKYKLSLKDIDILYKNLYDCINNYAA